MIPGRRPYESGWSGRALIVIGAPPGAWTPGLIWELEQIDTSNLWPKTIVVSPPLADDQLRWRWFAFATSGPANWPFRQGLPADPALILTLTRRSDELVRIHRQHPNRVELQGGHRCGSHPASLSLRYGHVRRFDRRRSE